MIVVVIISVLTTLGTLTYQQHLARLQLTEARAALIQDAHFLENWYAKYGSFKASAVTWPVLPITATSHFDIVFLAHPSNTPSGKFRLYACPRPDNRKATHYLVLDEDGVVKACSRQRRGRQCE